MYRVDLVVQRFGSVFEDQFFERTDANTSNPLTFSNSDDVFVQMTVSGVRSDGSDTPGINCGAQFLDSISGG